MKKRLLAMLLVIVTVCSGFVACADYYDFDKYEDYILLGDASKLEISQTDMDDAILNAYYSYYDDEIQAKTLTSVELTSGTVRFGDKVNIDYNGYLYGETTVFTGGSTYENGVPKGTDLEIGSGSYIKGFESGLIGYEVGDTVYLNLYFPEDYGKEDLNGKQVRFEVKINKISARYDYPAMTDETVKTQSAGAYNTVDEFKAGVKANAEKDAVWADYYNLCKVKEFPEKELKDYYENTLATHKSYCTAWYGGDMNSYASAMGYTNASNFYSYLANQAAKQVKTDLLVLAVVEANKLEMNEADMDKEIKALYDEQVKAEAFDGSYRKFTKTYGRKALEIQIYTNVVVEHLLTKATTVDDSKFTGVKGSAKTGVTFYKDDVQQKGWVKFDIDRDGTDEDFYFDTDNGFAYENKAANVPTSNDSTDKKYYKFGRFGELMNVVDKVVESDGNGLIYAVDGIAQTGLVSIEKDGRIPNAELYYFDPETNHMLLGVHKLTFGAKEGLYYNFGETGIYRIDDTTGEYFTYEGVDFATVDKNNGIANGLIDKQYFNEGALFTGRKTIDDYDYYFNPEKDGEMVIEAFYTVDGDKYYCDKDGHIVKSTTITVETTVYTFDIDGKVIAEEPVTTEGE